MIFSEASQHKFPLFVYQSAELFVTLVKIFYSLYSQALNW